MAMTVPDRISDFLGQPTPDSWIDAAVADLPALLNDHANCELKAASTALSLLYRYPEQTGLCRQMSRLAREELRHFEQVRKYMQQNAVPFARLGASRYAGGLRDCVRPNEPGRLVDTLLVGAFIEARSCERFALLVPRLPSSLGAFYAGLLASEARHFENYLVLADQVCSPGSNELDRRVGEIGEVEAKLVVAPDSVFRFHSGPPPALEEIRSA